MIRFLDIVLSLIGLVLFGPFFIAIFVWIRLAEGSPVVFKQRRVGKGGRDFMLYKFRTMKVRVGGDSLLTVGEEDERITPSGKFLRHYKFDELPQLVNVLRGDMSMVGPRPEVRKYVDLYTPEQRRILEIRPGITDLASIKYIHENQILAETENPEITYINEILPNKIEINLEYIEKRNVFNYFRIIFLTFSRILS